MPGSGTLTFVPGDTSEVADVTVNGDTTFEGAPTATAETFSVMLADASGAGLSTSTATGTVTNDDVQPMISIADVSSAEGSTPGSTMPFVFTVALTGTSAQTVSVSYAVSAAGATNPASTFGVGADLTPVFGALSFVPGDSSEAVIVSVNQDATVEANETFFINLSNPSNATIADNQGLGTIVNDD